MPRPVKRDADKRLAQRVDVGGGEHRLDPGRQPRGVDVDCSYRRVRMRTAHEASMEHARQLDVVQIAAMAAQQPLELAPGNPSADAGGPRRDHFRIRHYDLSPMLWSFTLSASITAATASTMA